MKQENKYKLLNPSQRERLIEIIEDCVEDYGLEQVAGFIKLRNFSIPLAIKYLSTIIEGDDRAMMTLNKSSAGYLCECLAVNPAYVFEGKKPAYTN